MTSKKLAPLRLFVVLLFYAGMHFHRLTALDQTQRRDREGNRHNEKDSHQYSQLWLDYRNVSGAYRERVAPLCAAISGCWHDVKPSSIIMTNACDELVMGISGMLGQVPRNSSETLLANGVALTLTSSSNTATTWPPLTDLDGFRIQFDQSANLTTIVSKSPQGILYGVFRLLHLLRREIPFRTDNTNNDVISYPNAPLRCWNIWDNLDGTVERGYAGSQWHQRYPTSTKSSIVYPLLDYSATTARMKMYARLLASVGINVIVWTNVNACGHLNEYMLDSETIHHMGPLVELFFSYGIFSIVAPCISSPETVGNLTTSDPRNSTVYDWWRSKIHEIATTWSPGSFRGFLFKGDTEGQPGPNKYNMTELEGANYFGKLLAEVEAIVIWRAFSHPPHGGDQALYQFQRFKDWSNNRTSRNVVLQTKNGPFDFQPREPVHSLFGALSSTVNLIVEFQATQEYLGQAKHLVALVPQWNSYLSFPLGPNGFTLANVTNGGRNRMPFSGIAAVSNVGDAGNWTGHIMSAANFYGFGRLAWEGQQVSTTSILREWVEATFAGSTTHAMDVITGMLERSWEAYENYTSSLGWGQSFAFNHYDIDLGRRQDYINATKTHVGYNRSGYASTYHPVVAKRLRSLDTCPEELLLGFHNVPYTHKLAKHGNITVIDWIYSSHAEGARTARDFITKWHSIEDEVNLDSYAGLAGNKFKDVTSRLQIGSDDADLFSKSVIAFFKKLLDQQEGVAVPA